MGRRAVSVPRCGVHCNGWPLCLARHPLHCKTPHPAAEAGRSQSAELERLGRDGRAEWACPFACPRPVDRYQHLPCFPFVLSSYALSPSYVLLIASLHVCSLVATCTYTPLPASCTPMKHVLTVRKKYRLSLLGAIDCPAARCDAWREWVPCGRVIAAVVALLVRWCTAPHRLWARRRTAGATGAPTRG